MLRLMLSVRPVDKVMLKNLFFYVAQYGIRFLFPLIVTPFLAHVLMKDRFADFAIVNSCIWTSSVFMEFGYYLYGVARTGAVGEDRHALAALVSEIAGSKLLLAPFAAAAYLALSGWTGVLIRQPAATLIGLVSVLGYGASFAWYFQGRQRGMFVVLSEGAPQLVQLMLLLSLVRSPDQLWLVFTLQAIPPVTSLGVGLAAVMNEGLLGRPSLSTIRRSLSAASPYFFERVCYSTYTSIMPSLIALLATKSAVADYAIGERFGTFLAGLTLPLTQATMPRVARLAVSPGGGWGLSVGLVAFVTGVTVALAGAAAWGAPFVIDRFFSADFGAAGQVAQIFCATACCSSFGFSLANFILIPRNRAKIMFWSSSLALVFGLTAQFALVPRWGAPGAAVGRLISEGTVALVMALASLSLWRAEKRRRAPQLPAGADGSPEESWAAAESTASPKG